MKILVTGIRGQLGHDVMIEGQSRGYEMCGYDIDTMDLTKEDQVRSVVLNDRPDVVIHCAAYTAVDKAETERELCYAVNVDGSKYIAEAAADCDAKIIYISTDYVYSGKGDFPHLVTEERDPINYYGLTKSLGEDCVMNASNKWFIVRTSWVFGENGNNFVKTMLRLGKEKDFLTVVDDQIGSPTYTADLAKLLLDMAETEKYGIYHGTNSGFCSWYEFASEIMRMANLPCEVKPIPTKDYPTAATRPLNSRMDSSCLTDNGFREFPHWKNALERFCK